MTLEHDTMQKVACYAADAKGQELHPFHFIPRMLGPYDIEVDITHCGICHSDIHLIDNDWGNSVFPLIPGHEIIGTIKAKGDAVEEFEVGQRVGIGWQRSSCQHCEWCHQGEENLCLQQEATCIGHPGGFASKIFADSRFAFLIPDELLSEHAAPLLCGGATVFSPFIEHNIKPTDKVGVIGVGGLGHLAIQFASAFGCEVTVFSHSAEKKEEAMRLGADHFCATNDHRELMKHANTLDFILCTISHPINWVDYLNVLRPKGVICIVGAQSKSIEIPFFSILVGRKTVCGSNIASCPDIRKMLHFAAQHGIKAQVEVFSMDKVNEAIQKVRDGKVRYRAVLKN